MPLPRGSQAAAQQTVSNPHPNGTPRSGERRDQQASNPVARDFRVATIGKAYTSRMLESQGQGVYVGRIEPPAKSWTAFFVELVFDSGVQFPLKLTTAVRVLPDKLPFAEIDPATAPLEKRP